MNRTWIAVDSMPAAQHYSRLCLTVLAASVVGLVFMLGFACGQTQRGQLANDAIAAGFKIIDPEGFEVAAFDE